MRSEGELILASRRFDALSGDELYDALRLRARVFVVEQNCVYADIDGADRAAWHLLARDGTGMLAGYLRWFPAAASADGAARIGRVVVAPEARATGLGARLMTAALAEIARHDGPVPVAIAAQTYLERFYARLGFARTSADYLEDGIAHCDMRRAGGDGRARAKA